MGDVQVLKQWINPLYLVPETIQQVQKAFTSNAEVQSIQLGQFLLQSQAEKLVKALEKMKWQEAYIPHMYSHKLSSNESALKELYTFLGTAGFKALLGTMLKRELKTVTPKAFLFEHGDYTLMHDALEEKKHILCTFDFTMRWPENSGGQQVFMHSSAEPLIFVPSFNALNIVSMSGDVRSFLKYVNCNAGKSKRFIVQVRME